MFWTKTSVCSQCGHTFKSSTGKLRVPNMFTTDVTDYCAEHAPKYDRIVNNTHVRDGIPCTPEGELHEVMRMRMSLEREREITTLLDTNAIRRREQVADILSYLEKQTTKGTVAQKRMAQANLKAVKEILNINVK